MEEAMRIRGAKPVSPPRRKREEHKAAVPGIPGRRQEQPAALPAAIPGQRRDAERAARHGPGCSATAWVPSIPRTPPPGSAAAPSSAGWQRRGGEQTFNQPRATIMSYAQHWPRPREQRVLSPCSQRGQVDSRYPGQLGSAAGSGPASSLKSFKQARSKIHLPKAAGNHPFFVGNTLNNFQLKLQGKHALSDFHESSCPADSSLSVRLVQGSGWPWEWLR